MKDTKYTKVITCHSNADWDALASMTALCHLYPDAALLFPGSMTGHITQFYQDHIQGHYPTLHAKEIENHPIKTLIIADTANFSRIPALHSWLEHNKPEIHIWDHHLENLTENEGQEKAEKEDKNNEAYAHLSDLVLPDGKFIATFSRIEPLGATSSLICEAMQERGIAPGPTLATLLGLGIYADTGNFLYTTTTKRDLDAAAWLLEKDMDLKLVQSLLEEVYTPCQVHALHTLLENAEVHSIGQYTVSISTLLTENFISNLSKIAQDLINIQQSSALFILATMKDKLMLVARSLDESVNVSQVCKFFGGGGHPSAAFASIQDKMPKEVIETILQQMYAQIHTNKTAKDLMTSPAICLEEHTPMKQAELIMSRYGLKAAPVVVSGTRYCSGYIDYQTADRAVKHGLRDVRVSEYMQRSIYTSTKNGSLNALFDIILAERQRLVPIVDKCNTVLGVVTRTDLLNLFIDDLGQKPIISRGKAKSRQVAHLLKKNISEEAFSLLSFVGKLADKYEVDLYIVGGFVRDVLFDMPNIHSEDLDMVVEGECQDFIKALTKELSGHIQEHKHFLTSTISYHDKEGQKKSLDVATARLEYYEYPTALPTVELSSIKMDLYRRDFTINAMAIQLNEAKFGTLIDFFDGQNDLKQKNLRVMHTLSFVEDPTRILRAVRFEQRFTLRIVSQTEKLIKNALHLDLLEKLSGSRIVNEFSLIVHEKKPKDCFVRLHELGVLEKIHPSLKLNARRVELLERLVDILDWYALLYQNEEISYFTTYLIILLSGLDESDTLSVLDRLVIPQNTQLTILRTRQEIYHCTNRLKKWHEQKGKISQLHEILQRLSLEGLLICMARSKTEEGNKVLSHYITKWRKLRVDISGHDLQKLGLEKGPLCGVILRKVLMAKLDEKLSTKDEQLAYAKKLIEKQLLKDEIEAKKRKAMDENTQYNP